MKDYNLYVTAINKIFDYLEKMKAGWNSQDNLNYIESIEQYKQDVIQTAELIKNPATQPIALEEESNSETLEALGDD